MPSRSRDMPVAKEASPFTYEMLKPGHIYGWHSDTLDPQFMERWAALYPWDRPRNGCAPLGVANVLVMRAYLAVIAPRPPGNVHLSIKVLVAAALPVGARISAEVSCSGKHEKGARRFVDFHVAGRDDACRILVRADLRLLWAQ